MRSVVCDGYLQLSVQLEGGESLAICDDKPCRHEVLGGGRTSTLFDKCSLSAS